MVCWIWIVVKMFQDAGILHGILGIICGLYAFIWGWMAAGRLDLKNVMIAWSVAFVLSLCLNGAVVSLNPNMF